MTQCASHPIQSMQESMSSATQLGTYAKFTPKQKATTLAILHLATKCYSGQLALLSIAIAVGCGVLMLHIMTLMSLHKTAYYVVESVYGKQRKPGHDNACS